MNSPQAYTFPATLRRMLDSEEAERIARREGTLAVRVHGSHIHVTVKLRRCWALWMNWTPTDAELRRISDWLRRSSNICDLWLKVAVIAAAVYLALEIVPAFLPGGAADRVLSGGAR